MIPIRNVLLSAALVTCVACPAKAQSASGRDAAPLVVEGTVRQIFRATDKDWETYLVQIEVAKSEARKSPAGLARPRFPSPGESAYVHVGPAAVPKAQPLASEVRTTLPTAGTKVRAYLTARDDGGWQGSADWWQSLDEHSASDDTTAEADDATSTDRRLGLTTKLLKSGQQVVLRVVSVERGGPAQSAGLEVGDMIAAAKEQKLSLIVVDVNSGRSARVEIRPRGESGGEETAEADPPAAAPRVSLGLSAEPVTVGMRSALKVIRVDAEGPAANAGIEPGDIVVAANGTPTTGVEQLLSALRKSGPTLTLPIRDSRTGRNVDVEVCLGSATKGTPEEPPAKVNVPALVRIAMRRTGV